MGRVHSFFDKIFHKYNFKRTGNGFNIVMNYTPLGIALDRAQLALDSQVWADMQQYMPFATGNLIRQTNTLNQTVLGTGKVYKYDPNVEYAHYMYEGILYVDPVYRIGGFYSPDYGFWSRAGVTKVPSSRGLNYTNPKAKPHWDEEAIKNHSNEWLAIVKKELNK
ncbi:MAG: hypothetical protein KBT34_09835 [Prevotella sp.]|nr:hypothetical protein [Candidatus Prevotella equi]